MRFIITHNTNAHWETGAIPDQELIDRVQNLLGEIEAAGALLGGEGLGPSSAGVRLRFGAGGPTITPGPFQADKELPTGFSIVNVGSIQEAIEWATRQARITGDVEVDIRPMHEPWDVGMAPRPEGLTKRRYMILRKASSASEAGTALTAEAGSRLRELIDEATKSNVHLASETMKPSRAGRRYANSHHGRTFYDGPFLETKELLGGYIIVRANTLEEACRWVAGYADAIGADTVDVRELEEPRPSASGD